MRNCSILIPTHNGADILEECLPSVVAETAAREAGDEIIVLDNASTDGTRKFIREKYPNIKIFRLKENKAIFALNDGAREAHNDYLFFLNNDMLLKPGCISALLDRFDAEDVFAVTGKVFQWDGNAVQAARRKPVFKHGYFWYLAADGPDETGLTLHALGGQSIFHREKFLSLGGIDSLFSPFYHEDLDISWRALKSGWRILYEPRAEMVHKGAATAGRLYTKEQIAAIMQKNMFLFMWKNMRGPAFVRSYLTWLPLRAARAAARGDRAWLLGLADALKQLKVARRGWKRADNFELSDEEVFGLFGERPIW